MYDYLIVGAGLCGAVFARQALDSGKRVLIIEKRNHIAGNIYTENVSGINVHRYGAHIFHTNNTEVWTYVNRFANFNRYTNSPIANYKGEIYSLPFNMYTFNRMWGVVTPEEAQKKLDGQRAEITGEPRNLEEKAISMVGRDIYEKLVRGYTEKQWGRPCNELPEFIISRLPIRLTYDNNYFNALYQGIPTGGYTRMIERMLKGAVVCLNTDSLVYLCIFFMLNPSLHNLKKSSILPLIGLYFFQLLSFSNKAFFNVWNLRISFRMLFFGLNISRG